MIRKKFSRILSVIGMCCGTPVIMHDSFVIEEFRTACQSIEYMSLPEEEGKKLKERLMEFGKLTDDTVQSLKSIAKTTLGTAPEMMIFEKFALDAIDDAQAELTEKNAERTLSVIEKFQSVCRAITPTSNRIEEGEKLKKLLVEYGELTNDVAQTLTSFAEKTFQSSDLIPFKTVALDAIINARVELSRRSKVQQK